MLRKLSAFIIIILVALSGGWFWGKSQLTTILNQMKETKQISFDGLSFGGFPFKVNATLAHFEHKAQLNQVVSVTMKAEEVHALYCFWAPHSIKITFKDQAVDIEMPKNSLHITIQEGTGVLRKAPGDVLKFMGRTIDLKGVKIGEDTLPAIHIVSDKTEKEGVSTNKITFTLTDVSFGNIPGFFPIQSIKGQIELSEKEDKLQKILAQVDLKRSPLDVHLDFDVVPVGQTFDKGHLVLSAKGVDGLFEEMIQKGHMTPDQKASYQLYIAPYKVEDGSIRYAIEWKDGKAAAIANTKESAAVVAPSDGGNAAQEKKVVVAPAAEPAPASDPAAPALVAEPAASPAAA